MPYYIPSLPSLFVGGIGAFKDLYFLRLIVLRKASFISRFKGAGAGGEGDRCLLSLALFF